jgi:hypothetical protein
MRLGRILAVVLLCVAPAGASAQAWSDAYNAGNYEKAADLLQQIAIDSIRDMLLSTAPEPYRQLALMYSEGRGVSKNEITACTLAQMAGGATMMTAPNRHGADIHAYDAAIKHSEEFARTHCEPLTPDDRLAAGRSMGCFAFGMPEATATVAGRPVRIGRRGISLVESNDEPWELFGCPQLVARVRTTSLAPPDDAAPGVGARHFVEVFSWSVGTKDGAPVYVLGWHVYEVANQRIHFFAASDALVARSTWPGGGLPVEIEKGLTVEMIRSGHVRWKLQGSPPKRGWFILGEGMKR